MSLHLNTVAIIKALGPPPRTFHVSASDLPRVKGKLAGALFAFGLALVAIFLDLAISSDPSARHRGSNSHVALISGLFVAGLGVWSLIVRSQALKACRVGLESGRATVGHVESVTSKPAGGGASEDHYHIEYSDGEGRPHSLKACWTSSPRRVEPGGKVVVLHAINNPAVAAVYPLDYPTLQLDVSPMYVNSPKSSQRSAAAAETISTLARLGVSNRAGRSSPGAAAMEDALKNGLVMGVNELETGWFDEAIDSFDMVLKAAEQEDGLEEVRAALHEQRGLAYEGKGDTVRARVDFQAALRLDPGRAVAKSALARINAG